MKTEIKTSVFEVKKDNKWVKVRATSIKALHAWTLLNNIPDWRMCGMMSRKELQESQTLEIVA